LPCPLTTTLKRSSEDYELASHKLEEEDLAFLFLSSLDFKGIPREQQ
jgi:hypothetical protein